MRRIGFLLALLLIAGREPPLSDPLLETRAQALFTETRCLTCAGESMADSPSDFATDVRADIRRKLESGQSDRQIRQALRQQFGDAILTRPPFEGATLALWLGPFLLLVGGLAVLLSQRRG